MFTNTQSDALANAIKALGSVDNAQAKFAKAIDELRKSGVTPAAFDVKSDSIAETRSTIASLALTPTQFKLWGDNSTPQKKDGKWTERGKLVKLVDMRITRIRKALSGPAVKGAKSNTPRPLDQRIREDIGKLVKAVTTDRDAEPTLSADHGEMLAAFNRILDLVPEKRTKAPRH